MAENALVFTTRGGNQVLAEIEAQRLALDKKRAAVRAVTEEFRAEEKQQRETARLVQQIARENETAEERYRRKLEETRTALGKNADQAELLGRACITVAASIEVENGSIVAHREIEGGVEVVEAPLPAVVTRYPSSSSTPRSADWMAGSSSTTRMCSPATLRPPRRRASAWRAAYRR